VADKGAGMTLAIVEKATTPFSSTRAGRIDGLFSYGFDPQGKLFISKHSRRRHSRPGQSPVIILAPTADDDASGRPTAAAGALVGRRA